MLYVGFKKSTIECIKKPAANKAIADKTQIVANNQYRFDLMYTLPVPFVNWNITIPLKLLYHIISIFSKFLKMSHFSAILFGGCKETKKQGAFSAPILAHNSRKRAWKL
jgi:hypothetical protein